MLLFLVKLAKNYFIKAETYTPFFLKSQQINGKVKIINNVRLFFFFVFVFFAVSPSLRNVF